MAFTTAFIAHCPDADPADIKLLETPTYKMFSVAVKDQAEALAVAKKLVSEEGVESILLCPGFSHKDIAELSEAVGAGCGLGVARTDAPSQRIAMAAMKREGWF